MRPIRLWVSVLLVFTCITLASAQDSIRLRFQVSRNGAPVGNPEVSLTSGTAGRLAVDGIGTIVFTPTFRDPDSVSIAFDIVSGDRQLRPRLVVRGNDPGSVSWSSRSGKDAFRFTVTWVR